MENQPVSPQENNRQTWDILAEVNARSALYNLQGFKDGQTALQTLELEEVGAVDGKHLLHLQCHFGMDTLSWARKGAQVTGVDFSPKAIQMARALAGECQLPANFVCSPIEDLPANLDGQFDILYSTYGVLCWLPDLTRWAQVIAHFLKPGGFFYLADSHPLFDMYEAEDTPLQLSYPYFRQAAYRFENQGSYADRSAPVKTVAYEWPHSLSQIINALLDAGLHLKYLHEFPFLFYQKYPFMVEQSPGRWVLPQEYLSMPMTFSLKAVKPANKSN